VQYVCHRVAVTYLGQIVEEGSVEVIFRYPRHPYSQALISAYLFPDPHHRRVGNPVASALQGEIYRARSTCRSAAVSRAAARMPMPPAEPRRSCLSRARMGASCAAIASSRPDRRVKAERNPSLPEPENCLRRRCRVPRKSS
jgi:hypothetical protein